MDTEVRERGTRFSEGQKQRLSIARALLADAPVMILDEATSALDVATERRVLRQIIKKEPNRTVIVAAHRPSVFSGPASFPCAAGCTRWGTTGSRKWMKQASGNFWMHFRMEDNR